MPLTLAFHGAAGTVTGSKHLLSSDDTSLLVDCGLFQGVKALREKNWEPTEFGPKDISSVVLTHAHIDHSGYLPRLVRDGFHGPIYCTPATNEIVGILLLDAARIQEEDADHANRRGYSRHKPSLPLFTQDDAAAAVRQLQSVRFGRFVERGPFRFQLRPAGHILGSSFVDMSVRVGHGSTSIVFSGDVGPRGAPLHSDPSRLPACDALVLETTYGDRDRDPAPLADQLLKAVLAAVERGAVILIPAFAVARSQIVALELRRLIESGRLPDIPIDVDSPMAHDVTDVYTRHAGDRDLDGTGGSGGLFPRQIRFRSSVQDSRALNGAAGPRIVISSSGMLAGGRVLHHFRWVAPDPKNLILLVGYQAVGTRGRKLQDGATSIRMHGRDVQVRAEVNSLHGFSAHADADELVDWTLSGPEPPRTVFLVHGEPDAATAIEGRLTKHGIEAIKPSMHSRYEFVPKLRKWREL